MLFKLKDKIGFKKSKKDIQGLKVKISPKETAQEPVKVEDKSKRRK